jgi:hypothetical protein
LKDRLSKLKGKEAHLELNKYQNKVKPNVKNRFKKPKDALFCCMCAPPDEQYHSLHKLDCVLGKCDTYPGYERPPEEFEMTEDISFHWYDTLPSFSIHNILPKYPPEVEGVTLVRTKSCVACDMEQERDKKYVRGSFYISEKYLTEKRHHFRCFLTSFTYPGTKNIRIITF